MAIMHHAIRMIHSTDLLTASIGMINCNAGRDAATRRGRLMVAAIDAAAELSLCIIGELFKTLQQS